MVISAVILQAGVSVPYLRSPIFLKIGAILMVAVTCFRFLDADWYQELITRRNLQLLS